MTCHKTFAANHLFFLLFQGNLLPFIQLHGVSYGSRFINNKEGKKEEKKKKDIVNKSRK